MSVCECMETLEMAISAFVSLFEDIQVFQPVFSLISFLLPSCVCVWERVSLRCVFYNKRLFSVVIAVCLSLCMYVCVICVFFFAFKETVVRDGESQTVFKSPV